MKLLQLLSLLCILIVGFGTALVPDNAMFWLASPLDSYQLMRIAIGAILVIQFVTQPPRHLLFRILAAGLAISVGGWAISEVYAYHMEFLDMLVFLGASCTILATALERRYEETFGSWGSTTQTA
jgi:hypothetical protein